MEAENTTTSAHHAQKKQEASTDTDPENAADQSYENDIDQLAVSEATREKPTLPSRAADEDASSVGESSDEDNENGDGDGRKDLGLVISALQSSLITHSPNSKDDTLQTRRSVAKESTHDSKEAPDSAPIQPLGTSDTVQCKSLPGNHQEELDGNERLDRGITQDGLDEDADARPSEDIGPANHANHITMDHLDLKAIQINPLSPRDQERADEPILRAVRHLFNNRFMKAKRLFESKSTTDPLYALGLGSMAFLKAILTVDQQAGDRAMRVLMATYNISTAQIDVATKTHVGDKVFRYLSTYYNQIKSSTGKALPASPRPVTQKVVDAQRAAPISNGVLRAHIAKAECSLLMSILLLFKETHEGYVVCGRHLQRAYASYMLVWQEYKRMGQHYNEFIDRETVSGIQFGIGTVHLLLSALPARIRQAVAAVSWKPDKHLGFALLKLCVEERRIRSPLASLMLLAYYINLTSHCPQVLASEYTQPAIETLLDAQRTYPNSALFLYFAGRTSRLAHNLVLSTQSFTYAIEISRNEWAEVEVLHLCNYEIGFNFMMQHSWKEAAIIFEKLDKEQYWSPVLCRYLHGACLDMMGLHTEAILAFADITNLPHSKCVNTSMIEQYVQRKVRFFQESGYQDMDMTLCAVEYLYLFNALDFMDTALLDKSLALTDFAMNRILEAEKMEYKIRTRELLPDTPPPQYFDQRGTLLLIKASLLNSMGCYEEAIVHLNWIIDHKDQIDIDKWIVPFAFWEAGVTSWGLDEKSRGRHFWETAAKYTKYDFETRLSIRIHLALTRANELGVSLPAEKLSKDQMPQSPRLSVGSTTSAPKTPVSPSPHAAPDEAEKEQKTPNETCVKNNPFSDHSNEEDASSPIAETVGKDSMTRQSVVGDDDGRRSTLSID